MHSRLPRGVVPSPEGREELVCPPYIVTFISSRSFLLSLWAGKNPHGRFSPLTSPHGSGGTQVSGFSAGQMGGTILSSRLMDSRGV